MPTAPATDRSASTEAPPATDPLRELAALARQASSPEALLAEATRLLARHFGSPACTASVRTGARDIDSEQADPNAGPWLPKLRAALLEVRNNPRPLGQRFDIDDEGVAIIAAPINSDSLGAIAAIVACDTHEALDSVLRELRALATAVATALDVLSEPARAKGPSADKTADAIQRAGAYTSIEEFAFALTNNLRNKLGAESVAFALPRGVHAHIVSISGLDEVKDRSPGASAMRQAIEEAIDHRRPLCSQLDDAWQDRRVSTGHPLQRAWSSAAGNAAVATVPLFAGDELTGVVAIRRRVESPFSRDELDAAVELLAPFGAAVPMVQRATRSLIGHARDDARAFATAAIRPTAWGSKALGLGILVALAWFFFGTIPYEVTARAAVQPAEKVMLAAPYDASIASTHAQSGDRVSVGQLLAQLDTSDLELERAEFIAQRAALSVDLDQAVASGDLGSAALAAAERESVEARLATLARRIEAASVRAPGDGLLIAGDPQELLGQRLATGDPIFTFVPAEDLRVEFFTPEHAADALSPELPVTFAPDASPRSRLELTIERIQPSASTRDGRNVVPATAEPTTDDQPAWLVPGMEGSARVHVGKRRVWWVVLHRAIESVQGRFGP